MDTLALVPIGVHWTLVQVLHLNSLWFIKGLFFDVFAIFLAGGHLGCTKVKIQVDVIAPITSISIRVRDVLVNAATLIILSSLVPIISFTTMILTPVVLAV